jgi:dTDP-4-amino-4,6-dideoxygalactose transaminase
LLSNDDALAAKNQDYEGKGTNKYSFLTDNITRGYYEYVDIGNSYVQSNLLGALGLSQLKKIETVNKKRKEIAEFYLQELKGIEGLSFIRNTEGAQPNWHIFGILVPPQYRYWIMDALRSEGIYANVHYNPLHQNSYYRFMAKMRTSLELWRFLSVYCVCRCIPL